MGLPVPQQKLDRGKAAFVSKTEINCRRPDDGNLFPLLEGQDSGNSNGNASINITDISRNITSMTGNGHRWHSVSFQTPQCQDPEGNSITACVESENQMIGGIRNCQLLSISILMAAMQLAGEEKA
ncbi:NT-3 growth factor receptor isoform a precursor [Cricetulus griseus]|nr:NT-3 growth factor receptor isoform a precursor [Cricetulus griseus]